jgi:hypothetical protein
MRASVAAWALRLAVTSTVTAVLSFIVGGDGRAGADDDHTTDEPAASRPTA